MWLTLLVALILMCHLTQSAEPVDVSNRITGHIIAHSHCDPGWLDTFDDYYSKQVKHILDKVTTALTNDPELRFVWAETSFFKRWYETQTLGKKEAFRKLIASGQLEFIGGGWSQNDEATPDYIAIINQMTEGHEYLLKNFNVAPRFGWQIDPFGHSDVMPAIFQAIGFEAMVINRIHYKQKNVFKSASSMEFLWKSALSSQEYLSSNSYGNQGLFTHVLHTHYSAPSGYDWEEGASSITDRNIESKARGLCTQINNRAGAYRTKHLLVPFGDDFKFQRADVQFSNMKKLITFVRENPEKVECNLQFSTLSDYFDSVFASTDVSFPQLEGDFYPYADNDKSYWTGYYTTRPQLKQSSRRVEAVKRASEMVFAQARAVGIPQDPSVFEFLRTTREDTALFMHHDAITGTSRNNVVQDYTNRMTTASNRALSIIAETVEKLMQTTATSVKDKPRLTAVRSTLLVPELESPPVGYPIVVVNSLGWKRTEHVSVQIQNFDDRDIMVVVLDPEGLPVQAQIDPIWPSLTEHNPKSDVVELSFIAINIPPLGSATYFIQFVDAKNPGQYGVASTERSHTEIFYARAGSNKMGQRGQSNEVATAFRDYVTLTDIGAQPTVPNTILENTFLRAEFSHRTGQLEAVWDRKAGKRVESSLAFGHNTGVRESGAYLYRTLRSEYQDIPEDTPHPPVIVTKGNIHSRISVRSRSKYDKVYLLVNTADDHELGDHLQLVSNVDVGGNEELFISMKTDLPTNNKFETHNGLRWHIREIDDTGRKRSGGEAVDFYPGVTGARVSADGDVTESLTILTSHTMAVGCNEDGKIKFHVHRRLNQDDGRGLAEGVNDQSKVDIPIWFAPNLPSDQFRKRSLQMNFPVIVLQVSSSNSETYNSWTADHVTKLSPMKSSLPDAFHLLSFFARDSKSDEIVLRVERIDGDVASDADAPCDIMEFFEDMKITDIRRSSLSLNDQWPMRSKTTHRFNIDGMAPVVGQGVDDDFGENQNTDEAGVFLSKAALEKLAADRAAREAEKKGTARRLLSDKEVIIGNSQTIQTFKMTMRQESSAPAVPVQVVKEEPRQDVLPPVSDLPTEPKLPPAVLPDIIDRNEPINPSPSDRDDTPPPVQREEYIPKEGPILPAHEREKLPPPIETTVYGDAGNFLEGWVPALPDVNPYQDMLAEWFNNEQGTDDKAKEMHVQYNGRDYVSRHAHTFSHPAGLGQYMPDHREYAVVMFVSFMSLLCFFVRMHLGRDLRGAFCCDSMSWETDEESVLTSRSSRPQPPAVNLSLKNA